MESNKDRNFPYKRLKNWCLGRRIQYDDPYREQNKNKKYIYIISNPAYRGYKIGVTDSLDMRVKLMHEHEEKRHGFKLPPFVLWHSFLPYPGEAYKIEQRILANHRCRGEWIQDASLEEIRKEMHGLVQRGWKRHTRRANKEYRDRIRAAVDKGHCYLFLYTRMDGSSGLRPVKIPQHLRGI